MYHCWLYVKLHEKFAYDIYFDVALTHMFKLLARWKEAIPSVGIEPQELKLKYDVHIPKTSKYYFINIFVLPFLHIENFKKPYLVNRKMAFSRLKIKYSEILLSWRYRTGKNVQKIFNKLFCESKKNWITEMCKRWTPHEHHMSTTLINELINQIYYHKTYLIKSF